ncbi:type 1 fimbrial protein [Salmonella enterica subsp. enterica serovar Panama]|uniref:Type 1 fimbrial protein n=1 Tax=Salmonella enterica subsp. enterica serovar Panama TaxID=29472 RepID=A0A619AIY9_SALET|nr:type 1 fimbrial protein [Salmonella enterica subsp. enterica serovar Panama]ECX3497851.1 type 1 fimbrial protein [Salmonella enterica subsp. enterica serovar Panama]ECX6035214.1 type 1 fimbrial protein [Salmonella enterica subsp. enterica serovar Panama]EGX1720111.1 type 1 fimbrial protein [Salmonella enterica subsp. enterica serovar Panama]HAF4898640.1 type 1 fimbrial protein [Salmonella enterica]
MMNRTEQRMKHAEKAGNNSTGKVSAARSRYPSRLSAISGLALLLSCGVCGSASALTFTFDYTYTIVANTCELTSTGADVNKGLDVNGADNPSVDFDVNWGTVTKSQLTNSGQYSKKTFGLVMDCGGDIYQPTLTVRPTNGDTASTPGIVYVTDTPGSIAGFAVRASDASDATETNVTQDALNQPGNQHALSETGHNKKILLEAWPVILPGRDVQNLKSGTDIKGAVTINVSYN